MKLTDIEKVLLEQQDELEALEGEVLIHRPEEDLINLKSKLAQVAIGVRRSGKSTLCFNALRKAGTEYDIYYYQSRNAEADFVVCDGNKTLAVYQVSYDISNEKTRKREIKGCIAGAKATQCNNLFLITDHESENIKEEGYTIQVIPVWEWLTNS